MNEIKKVIRHCIGMALLSPIDLKGKKILNCNGWSYRQEVSLSLLQWE